MVAFEPHSELPIGSFDGGMVWKADSPDAPPDSMQEALNLVCDEPFGTVRKRPGSRLFVWPDSEWGQAVTRPGSFGYNAGFGQIVNLAYFEHAETGGRWLVSINIINQATGEFEVWTHRMPDGFTDNDGEFWREALDPLGTAAAKQFTADVPDLVVLPDAVLIVTGSTLANGVLVLKERDDGLRMQLYPVIGYDRPNTAASAATSGAGDLTGDYKWQYVWRDPNTGWTSGASPAMAAAVSMSSNTAQVTIVDPTSISAGLVADIYRTVAFGAVHFKHPTLIGVTGTTHNDTSSDDGLGVEQPPIRYGTPKSCKFAHAAKNRVWYGHFTDGDAGTAGPSLLVHTEPGAPLTVDRANNGLPVNPEDGQKLVVSHELYDGQNFAHKPDFIYQIIGSGPPFAVQRLATKPGHGCIARRTLVRVGSRAFYLAKAGIVMFDGQNAEAISHAIDDFFTEPQLQDQALTTGGGTATPKREVVFSFTQQDYVTESFHFELEVAVGGYGNTALETIDSASTPAFFSLAGGGAYPSGGVSLAHLQQTTVIAEFQNANADGTVYYPRVRANDGTEVSPWENLPTYVGGGSEATTAPGDAINWALVERFHAIYYWPRGEYWLFVASRPSSVIDTLIRVDLKRMSAGKLPIQRDVSFAGASIMVPSISVNRRHPADLPLIGDHEGLLWVLAWSEDAIDGDRPTTTAFAGNRTRTGLVVPNNIINATDGAAWPDGTGYNILNGTAVTFVDDATYKVYSGIIAISGPNAVTVARWYRNEAPPVGATGPVSIGGIAGEIETQWLTPMPSDRTHVVQLFGLLANAGRFGIGPSTRVEARVARSSQQSRYLDPSGYFARFIASFSAPANGSVIRSLRARGVMAMIRIVNAAAGEQMGINHLTLRYQKTGARR